jgi:hypothetical protein
MKMFIILDMKKNKIDNFSLKIIVLTSIEYWPLKEYWLGRLKLPGFLSTLLTLTSQLHSLGSTLAKWDKTSFFSAEVATFMQVWLIYRQISFNGCKNEKLVLNNKENHSYILNLY